MIYQDQTKQLLQKNTQLIDEINQVAENIKIQDDDYRKMLFVTYFSIATEHFIAIDVLFEKKCATSAFAMIRVFFDSIVRCLYLYYFFDDDKIDKFYNEEKSDFPDSTKMCKKLDEKLGYDFNDIRKKYYGKMCDYTHTGYLQATHHVNKNTSKIEAIYGNNLIYNTIKSNNALIKILLDELKKIYM